MLKISNVRNLALLSALAVSFAAADSEIYALANPQNARNSEISAILNSQNAKSSKIPALVNLQDVKSSEFIALANPQDTSKSGLLAAANSPKAQNSDIYANLNSISLGATIISATGFEQEADENIRNVVVIEGEELRKRGYTDLQEALSRVGGVNFTNSGAGDVIDLRGQGAKANVATKVMIDGKAMNLLDATVAVTPINAINIDEIDHIEIIPGGGAVLYGNGTRGGVINIITKRSKAPHASVSVLAQGFDKDFGRNANLAFGGQLNEQIAYNFDINSFDNKLYRYDERQQGVYLNSKILVDLNENQSLNLGANYYTSTITNAGNLTKAQIDDNPRQTQPNFTPTTLRITRPNFDINYHLILNSHIEFDASAFWQKQSIEYTNDENYSSGSSAGSEFTDTLTGLKFKGKFSYLQKSYLVFGYDLALHKNTRDLRTDVRPNAMMRVQNQVLADMKKDSHSVFALNSFAFGESGVNLALGARYEFAKYDSYRNSTTITSMPMPSGSTTIRDYKIPAHDDGNFAFELTPSFSYSKLGKIYAKYERGFISPNPSQLTNKTAANVYYFSDLKSEIFDTFELGLSDYWRFFGLQITAFYTLTKDEITQFGPGFSSWWENRNIDETRRFGVELNLRQDFEIVSFKEYFHYLDAMITAGANDGKMLPYVSRFMAGVGAEFDLVRGLLIFVDANYHSRAKDQGRVINTSTGEMADNAWIKEFVIVDLGLNYDYKGFEVMAGIKNVLGTKHYSYQNAAANNFQGSYLPGNSRSYYLGVGYRF